MLTIYIQFIDIKCQYTAILTDLYMSDNIFERRKQMLKKNEWKQINNDSTGYLGSKRNYEYGKRNKKYGKGNWKIGWVCGDLILDYLEVCQMYEDAYFEYLSYRPELIEYLENIASDVYDDDPKNTESELDYLKRGKVRTHIQDIAIRRCMMRLGKSFKGKKLIQIRDRDGKDPISKTLSPGQVPFHKIELITIPSNIDWVHNKRWWLINSVEDFYQRNKRVFLKI